MRPRWSGRLRRVVDGCARLARGLSTARCTAIHRDFYPDQVLVGRTGRLFLLDLDLYATGDPMLDVGNFAGHLIERAIREPSLSRSLTAAIAAFESRSLERVNDAAARALNVYTTLTLARHIYLSTHFPERQRTTLRLLHLCEERLAAVERVGRVTATQYVTEVCQ